MMVRRIKPVMRARRGGRIRRFADPDTARGETPDLAGGWVPALDIYETAESLVLEVEMPGLSARGLSIVLRASRIEIRGLKAEGAAPAGARYLRLEREFGPFRRTVALPCAVQPDRARATLDNGLLTVVMRKDRPGPRRDIVVKVRRGG